MILHTSLQSETWNRLECEPTTNTLTDELWGVFCEDFQENWPRYNGTALYIKIVTSVSIHQAHGSLGVTPRNIAFEFDKWVESNTWEEQKLGALGFSLRWRHNGCDSISNHQPHHCLLNRLFRRRSKKTSKLRVTGLCVEYSRTNGQ